MSAFEKSLVNEKGIETIRAHCEWFIRTRLAPVYPQHDGRQTPMRGHPVFVAQHACACCCRDCLAKWECARAEGVGLGECEARTAKQPQGRAKVPRGVAIPVERQQGIVDFLMAWMEMEMCSYSYP